MTPCSRKLLFCPLQDHEKMQKKWLKLYFALSNLRQKDDLRHKKCIHIPCNKLSLKLWLNQKTDTQQERLHADSTQFHEFENKSIVSGETRPYGTPLCSNQGVLARGFAKALSFATFLIYRFSWNIVSSWDVPHSNRIGLFF